jgi:hypothetical protein
MRRTPTLIAAAITVLALAGCASAGSSSGGPPPPTGTAANPAGSPSAAAPSSPALAAAPSATASPPPCTTHSCIAQDAKGLVGAVAQDESVITAMDCYQSTVKHAAPGIWTVDCTATYSDGSQVSGIATVLLSQDKVTWEPTD